SNSVRQWIVTACWNGSKRISRRSIGQTENLRVIRRLVQVLRHLRRVRECQHLSKNVSRPTHSICPPVSCAQDCIATYLPCQPDAWRELRPVLTNVQISSPRTVSSDANIPGIQIQQTALAFSVHGLREIHVPADAIIHRQRVGSAPLVLGKEERAFLTFLCVGVLRLRSLERGHVAEDKGSEAKSGSQIPVRIYTRGPWRAKMEVAGTNIVVVQAHQVIHGVAKVGAEPDGVIPHLMSPV